MKFLKKNITLCNYFFATLTAEAKSKIQIDNDENDCVDGWVSMDITINQFQFIVRQKINLAITNTEVILQKA